jgi:flagellar biosynthesis protein FlhA
MPEAVRANPNRVTGWLQRNRGLLLPIAVVCLILVIVVQLPPWLMDLMLALNITLGAVILLTVIFMNQPLEFSSFPSLLLATTLFRLVLNVGTTRLILTRGAEAEAAGDATAAAGHVIQAFGKFVAGNNLAVGFVIFLILVVIQFVVITKGATRIAEVAARFTLDGMPGKQMSIDADLNSGLIDEQEARRRREQIRQEADFYGAMDGASKFVKGDAIAGIVITLVNILGGLYVGMGEFGWPADRTVQVFTKLTIGDGLVSQVPAFLISLAAGMLVTRSASRVNLGEELLGQVFGKPQALFIAAGFLLLLSVTGLPLVPMVSLSAVCGTLGWVMSRSRRQAREAAQRAEAEKTAAPQERIIDAIKVDPLELEVGYGLIRLVDPAQGGDLRDRISMIRRQVALELGLIMPPVRIRDNMQLGPNDYSIKIKGVPIAGGSVMPGYYLAINSGAAQGQIGGIETTEPAFGLPAKWISEDLRSRADMLNYTVIEAPGVLATHLTEAIKGHAAELLSREETNRLVEAVKERAPKLVEDVVGDALKLGEIRKVLQNLLRERVPIRDLETILEALGDWAGRTKDLELLTECCRNALAPVICQQLSGDGGKIHVVTLDPAVEDLVNGHVQRDERGGSLSLPPTAARRLVEAINEQMQALVAAGHRPVLLCSPQIRVHVRRLCEQSMPQLSVLAYNEVVRGVEVESVGMVVLEP